MTERPENILLCTCDDTMPLDDDAVRRGCRGASVKTVRRLCRAEVAHFRAAAETGDALIVGCTQEAPLFTELTIEVGATDVSFVNLRETAGWSDEAAGAGPKIAALIAAARETAPAVPFIRLKSAGSILVYGRDESAVETGMLLKEHLDVTVLLTGPDGIAPRRVSDFPVARGTIRYASGYLGAFDIVVDDFALSLPSSRTALAFAPARHGAQSRCDILLDISGKAPLFSAADLRDGYLRADPGNAANVLHAVLKARELVGTFDKPRYIAFTKHLCAHSRSRIIGCHRCLDLCPTGAIVPAGDHVAIDAAICAGCGQCAATCPSGAAAYVLPPADVLMRKLRKLLVIYREAGGENPVVLLHDDDHGGELIAALARHGAGLPANVLPVALNEVTQIGLETIISAFAYGASGLRVLLREKPRHDLAGLRQTIALAGPIISALGYGSLATIETDDPDSLGAALRAIDAHAPTPRPANFMPLGQKREILQLALRALREAAPTAVDVIALPPGAPFGTVEIHVGDCTLCLACVAACPSGALKDDPEQPQLRFIEDACIQCGLCKATCPEKVITLVPRLDFHAAAASARVLKAEEPFACIKCSKPFGVKSTIERVSKELESRHWMYASGSQRLDLIKMCGECRVVAVIADEFNPRGVPSRPAVRTTDDYLREREGRPHPDDSE